MNCSNCDDLKSIVLTIKTQLMPIVELINKLNFDENPRALQPSEIQRLKNVINPLIQTEIETEPIVVDVSEDDLQHFQSHTDKNHSSNVTHRKKHQRSDSTSDDTPSPKHLKSSEGEKSSVAEETSVDSTHLSQLVFNDVQTKKIS